MVELGFGGTFMSTKLGLILGAASALALAGEALAHGGGLNADGCHNDRKNGGYHCHRSPAVERPRTQPQPARVQGLADTGTGGASYYPNCAAARAAGAAPVRRGDPGYDRRLDRDGDGVGCE